MNFIPGATKMGDQVVWIWLRDCLQEGKIKCGG
jgi:hypothetical protein